MKAFLTHGSNQGDYLRTQIEDWCSMFLYLHRIIDGGKENLGIRCGLAE